MRNRTVWPGVMVGLWAGVLAGVCGVAGAQVSGGAGSGGAGSSGAGVGSEVERRPMTFADLERMKRVSDPQVSPSGRWVMFSVVEVDLAKNSKVSHLWVVPLSGPGGGETASSGRESSGGGEPTSQNRDPSQARGQVVVHPGAGGVERQVTFWKEGESGGRFSPDGKQVLFVASDSGDGMSQVFLAPWDDASGALGTPVRLTHVSTEADGAIWSPDGKRILFTSRVYPECSDEATWLEEDGCDKRKDDAAAANPVKAQVWDHLLYRHWDHYVGPKRSHVLVVLTTDGNAVRDLTPRRDIGDAEAPTFSLGGPLGYAWAPDAREIAFVTNVDLVPAASTNNDVFTLRLDDAGARPRKISTSLGSDDGPAYSSDGKYIAFRSQARAGYESDRFRLMLFDRRLDTAQEVLPKFDRWVDEFVWAPDASSILFSSADSGETLVYSVAIADETTLKYVPVPTGQLTLLMSGRNAESGELQVSADGMWLVSTAMTVEAPAEVFRTSLRALSEEGAVSRERRVSLRAAARARTGAAPVDDAVPAGSEALTHLNDSVLERLALPKMETYWFTGAEGARVQGFVIRPPGFDAALRYPVKFLIHGGPQGAWGDAWSYRWNPELMAASGYVVVMVNPRGSTGYGQAFIDGVNGDWGGKAYVDLMKGLDYAEQHFGFLDKTRECALGASYGGYMADWMLTHTDRFACLVTHDGMFNPQSAYGTTEELWFNEWEFRRAGGMTKEHEAEGAGQPWRYAAGPVAEDPFRKWSPVLSIQNAKTPTLVIHSQRDYRLDVSEGMQLFTALQRLNVPSRMLYFPDEGHWVLKPQNSKLWYETVGDWCDRWTKTNVYRTGSTYVAEGAGARQGTETVAPAAAPEMVKPKPQPKPSAAPVMRSAPPVPAPQPKATPAAPAAVAPEVRSTAAPQPKPQPVTPPAPVAPAVAPRTPLVAITRPVVPAPVLATLPQVSQVQLKPEPVPTAPLASVVVPTVPKVTKSQSLPASQPAVPAPVVRSSPPVPASQPKQQQVSPAPVAPAAVPNVPLRSPSPPVVTQPVPQPAPQPAAPAVIAPPVQKAQPAPIAPLREGTLNGTFAITISAPEQEVPVGSDARVEIRLKNLSDHQILFAHRPGRDHPEFSFVFLVRDAAGHLMGEDIAPEQGASERRTVDYVQPGGTVIQTGHLTRLVDLTHPGRYTVRVYRRDTEKNMVVQSNEITLDVVAAGGTGRH